jgi:hypothetical protein
VTALFEICTQHSVVVDLAVEDKPRAVVAAVHRLMSRRRKIDNREPSKDQLARIVRPAMRHLIAHAREQRRLNSSFARPVFPNSTNSTHKP